MSVPTSIKVWVDPDGNARGLELGELDELDQRLNLGWRVVTYVLNGTSVAPTKKAAPQDGFENTPGRICSGCSGDGCEKCNGTGLTPDLRVVS